MKSATELPTTSAGEAIQVLRAHAEGHMHHLNRGVCPDEVAGHESRDADCAVCNALKALAASPAPGRAPLTETHVQALRSATPGGDWFDEEQAAIFERGIRAAERYHGIAPAGGIGGE